MPPEYCMVDKKDCTECKAWIKSTHPELYQKIWPDEEVKEGEEKPATDQPPTQQQKKKKKVGFGSA